MAGKIKVFKEDDRVTVSSILVKNGYKVWLSKVRRGKTYDYYLNYEEVQEEEKTIDGEVCGLGGAPGKGKT